MFNMVEFITSNLIEGFHNDSFTKQQVNIFAVNYLSKGMLTQEDCNDILEAIEPVEVDEE